jgi:hypothetical protein
MLLQTETHYFQRSKKKYPAITVIAAIIINGSIILNVVKQALLKQHSHGMNLYAPRVQQQLGKIQMDATTGPDLEGSCNVVSLLRRGY